MNQLLPIKFTDTFRELRSSLSMQAHEWAGRVVVSLKWALAYLEDPRASLLLWNFVIIEIASRIAERIAPAIPVKKDEKQTILNFHSIFGYTIQVGLVIAGNLAFVRMTAIKLKPLVIAGIAAVSFGMSKLMVEYLAEKKVP